MHYSFYTKTGISYQQEKVIGFHNKISDQNTATWCVILWEDWSLLSVDIPT